MDPSGLGYKPVTGFYERSNDKFCLHKKEEFLESQSNCKFYNKEPVLCTYVIVRHRSLKNLR